MHGCIEHSTRSLFNRKLQQKNDSINPIHSGMKSHTCSLKYFEQCTSGTTHQFDLHRNRGTSYKHNSNSLFSIQGSRSYINLSNMVHTFILWVSSPLWMGNLVPPGLALRKWCWPKSMVTPEAWSIYYKRHAQHAAYSPKLKKMWLFEQIAWWWHLDRPTHVMVIAHQQGGAMTETALYLRCMLMFVN